MNCIKILLVVFGTGREDPNGDPFCLGSALHDTLDPDLSLCWMRKTHRALVGTDYIFCFVIVKFLINAIEAGCLCRPGCMGQVLLTSAGWFCSAPIHIYRSIPLLRAAPLNNSMLCCYGMGMTASLRAHKTTDPPRKSLVVLYASLPLHVSKAD